MTKIVCEECGTEYKYEVAKNMKNCPVCGASMMGDDDFSHEESPDKDSGKAVEKKTFYYYDSGTLTGTLYSHRKPIYTFQATDIDDAERQLKGVCPNSPLFETTPSKQIRCPRCMSTQFQLVPRKFSLLTGFATNKFDRMCVMCKKRF